MLGGRAEVVGASSVWVADTDNAAGRWLDSNTRVGQPRRLPLISLLFLALAQDGLHRPFDCNLLIPPPRPVCLSPPSLVKFSASGPDSYPFCEVCIYASYSKLNAVMELFRGRKERGNCRDEVSSIRGRS